MQITKHGYMEIIFTLLGRRDLFWQFLSRNLKTRHRGSWLGSFWLLANPLLMLSLYVFAFGIVFGGRFTDSPDESTLDYALGVFIGLNVLGLVSGVIGTSPGIIISHPNFVRKVVFPLEILPAALTGALAYDLLIGFGLSLLGIAIWGPGLGISCLFAPILIAPVLIIGLGLSLIFSALGVFIRDLGMLGSFFGLSLLYASGVFYSAEKAKEMAPQIWTFLQWNPLLQIIDGLRQIVLWGGQPDWWTVGYAWLFAIGILLLGCYSFQRLRPAFGDVI